MITTIALIIAALFALLASAFFSGMETGVYCLNRVRLRVRSDSGEPGARRLAALMERPDALVITALVGTNIADYCLTISVAALVVAAGASTSGVELYTTLISTPLVLVFGGILPKDLFNRFADTWMYVVSSPIALCRGLVRYSGVLWLMQRAPEALLRLVDPAHKLADDAVVPRARVRRLLHEGAARGGLSQFQRETIERVMDLSQVPLSRVLVSLRRAATVPETISRNDFLRIARMAHFSRLPVYRASPTDVLGYVHVFDILMDPQKRPIRDYVRPIFGLREDESVAAALVRMQRAHEVIAIVRDRRGVAVGLLTMKDLAEEIVGELQAW